MHSAFRIPVRFHPNLVVSLLLSAIQCAGLNFEHALTSHFFLPLVNNLKCKLPDRFLPKEKKCFSKGRKCNQLLLLRSFTAFQWKLKIYGRHIVLNHSLTIIY